MSRDPRITPEAKAHPDYSVGYMDGISRIPKNACEPDSPYDIGYDAGAWAAGMFESVGFESDGDGGFSLALTLPPESTGDQTLGAPTENG